MSSAAEQISRGDDALRARLTALWKTPDTWIAWLSTVDHKALGKRYIYTAFARDVARGVNPGWVRNLYQFAVKPTIAFYFRISVEQAMTRIVGGRDAISYYEAGMDRGLSSDIEESFRLFQTSVVDQYDRMVKEFGLVVIDASRSIEEQQIEMRKIVTKALTGARKTRLRRWVDLHSMAKASRQLNQAS